MHVGRCGCACICCVQVGRGGTGEEQRSSGAAEQRRREKRSRGAGGGEEWEEEWSGGGRRGERRKRGKKEEEEGKITKKAGAWEKFTFRTNNYGMESRNMGGARFPRVRMGSGRYQDGQWEISGWAMGDIREDSIGG